MQKIEESKSLKRAELNQALSTLKVSAISQKSGPSVHARLKSKKEDEEITDEEKDEEENEIKLCGAKCRKIPENLRANFIHVLFDDYIRMQTTVALTWSTLNK